MVAIEVCGPSGGSDLDKVDWNSNSKDALDRLMVFS